MKKASNWLWLGAFIALWCALRIFWIDADAGVPSLWEYGYNVTDEGYYLDGGKEKLIWGHFVDLSRNEAFTYGFSAGTHWLSWFAHLLFGLSTWTWRLPFFAIYFVAWLAMFRHVSRRSGPASAFALCTSFSLVPMVVAYERTASNDALIAALLVLSYVCAAGRSMWRIAVGGVLTGMISLVKPSVWVLLPIAAAGVAEGRDIRQCLKGLLLFASVAVAAVFACRMAVVLSVLPDAANAGVSAWEVIRKTTTHYPLPSVFDFASHFKGLSAFPRDPSIQFLGVVSPLIVSVPFAMAAKNVVAKRWNGHLLLFLAVPAYVAAVSVMNTIYTHYFLPVILMLPIIMNAVVRELEQECDNHEAVSFRKAAPPFIIVSALCVIGALQLASLKESPALVQNFYSRIYNFPARNVWGLTWGPIVLFSVLATLCVAIMRRFKLAALWAVALPLAALVSASVAFSALPASYLAPYIKKATGEYFAPLVLSMSVSALFLVAAFGFTGRIPWRKVISLAVPVCVLVCFLATPNWRDAFGELIQKGRHVHAEVAMELAELLPQDAIVIGERSNQVLMSLPVRTATTFASNSDPIPVIKSILKDEPDAKLFALADSQHAYNLQHFREHAKEYRLDLIKEFKMPSFSNGQPASVYLCRIVQLNAVKGDK